MKNYELLYIVSAQYTEKELGEIRKKIEALIAKNGGAVHYTDLLGKRRLAYPVKKALHGYYVIAEFELADGRALAEIGKNLKLDKEVLRAQIIVKKQKTDREALAKKQKKGGQTTEKTPVENVTRNIELDRSNTGAKTKDKMKNLDEKLEEILKDETIL